MTANPTTKPLPPANMPGGLPNRGRRGILPAGGIAPPPRVPVRIAEFALFLYVSTMLFALSAPQWNTLSNYFGLVVAAICFAELGLFRAKASLFHQLRPLVVMGLFVLLVATAIVYRPDGINYIQRSVLIFGLLIIVFMTIRATGRITSVSAGFAAGVLILWPLVLQQADFLQSGQRLELDVANTGEGGLNPNGYGILLNIAVLLSLYEIYINLSRRSGLLKYVIFAICIAVIAIATYQIVFFLGSRQNQLWLMLTFIGVSFLISQGRFSLERIVIGAFIGAFLLGILFFLFRESPHLERVMSPVNVLVHGEDLSGSDATRINMIKRGFSLWLTSPIWGLGVEGYQIYSGFATYSHNMFIEILVNYGLFGFCLFFSYYFLVIKRSFRFLKIPNPRVRVMAIWIMLSFVGVFVSHMFRPTPYDKPMFIFLGTLGGLAYFLYDQYGNRRMEMRGLGRPGNPRRPRRV